MLNGESAGKLEVARTNVGGVVGGELQKDFAVLVSIELLAMTPHG